MNQGSTSFRPSSRRHVKGVLVVYYSPLSSYASMIMDLVEAFERDSQYPVWSVNIERPFPSELWQFEFDAVVLHYSLFGWKPFALSGEFLEYVEACSSSCRVAFFQDEYRFWPERGALLRRLDVRCVFTCLEPQYHATTYGRHTDARVETYLPGYVSPQMVQWGKELAKPHSARWVDIGYRGRRGYTYMGKGAEEKHEIGVRFLERARGEGLILDIETEERRRIYGKAWIAFLSDCRASLGVEAGVSIFDLEDEVLPIYERLMTAHPDLSFGPHHDAAFARFEGIGPVYRTIAPRIFEATASRTALILYPGSYSGLLTPWTHYIPLARDFSNWDEVLRAFRDQALREALVDRCERDLIDSGDFAYSKFMRRFDTIIQELGVPAPKSKDRDPRVHIPITSAPVPAPPRRRPWVKRVQSAVVREAKKVKGKFS